MNELIFNGADYRKLIMMLKGRLEDIKLLPDMKNIKFEIEFLLSTLTDFAQYDEQQDVYIVPLSIQNKDRLIGFLLEQLLRQMR